MSHEGQGSGRGHFACRETRMGKFTIQGKYEEFRIPDVVFSAWGIGCT